MAVKGTTLLPVRPSVVGEGESREPHGARLGRHVAVDRARVGVVERERVAGVEPAQRSLVRQLAVLAVDACLSVHFILFCVFVEQELSPERSLISYLN